MYIGYRRYDGLETSLTDVQLLYLTKCACCSRLCTVERMGLRIVMDLLVMAIVTDTRRAREEPDHLSG